MADSTEEIYGLIGFPLTHSFSKTFFNQKFESEHINARYLNFELPDIGDLMEAIAEYPRLQGFNVTLPYKEQVIDYLDEIDPIAEKIGAVNVVRVEHRKNGVWLKGYNSDVIGFCDSIRPLLKPWHTNALVLGSGGASKAICQGLLDLGVEPIVVSRSKREGALTYEDLTPEVIAEHKVVVNTTPLGMYPRMDTCPDIPYDCLSPEHLCYDLVYNPEETLFMRRSAEHGAVVKNGLEMLLLQAFAAWQIWNNR